jgi:hypothetical protein
VKADRPVSDDVPPRAHSQDEDINPWSSYGHSTSSYTPIAHLNDIEVVETLDDDTARMIKARLEKSSGLTSSGRWKQFLRSSQQPDWLRRTNYNLGSPSSLRFISFAILKNVVNTYNGNKQISEVYIIFMY